MELSSTIVDEAFESVRAARKTTWHHLQGSNFHVIYQAEWEGASRRLAENVS